MTPCLLIINHHHLNLHESICISECILVHLSWFLDLQTWFKCSHNHVISLYYLALFAYVILLVIAQKSTIYLLSVAFAALCSCTYVGMKGNVLYLLLLSYVDRSCVYTDMSIIHKNNYSKFQKFSEEILSWSLTSTATEMISLITQPCNLFASLVIICLCDKFIYINKNRIFSAIPTDHCYFQF